MNRRRSFGFTLIEVLVSVFLLSVLSAFCYGTLTYVSRARDGAQSAFERTRTLQLAMNALVTDFEQLEPRPVRDALGDPLPALRSDRRTQDIVALTRGGWSNTAGLPRGTLQRVTYRLQGDTLIRSYTTVLDITLANAPVERELLKGVNSVTFRFMDAGRQWQEQWPSLAAAPGAAATGGGSTPPGFRSRPMAVEITIDLKDTGKIVRLVEVPS